MSEAGRESKARLGVFVVSGIVLAAAGVIALGAGRIFEKTVPLHCYFHESVEGLDPGSAVSYRGVRLGRVTEVRMRQTPRGQGDEKGHAAVIEVVSSLDPAQLARFGTTSASPEDVEATIANEVREGLRVRIAWKDITGQKYLDVDYFGATDPDAVTPDLGFAPDRPYIPTYTEKSFSDIQKDLATTLGNLSKIDYAALGARLEQLLDQLSTKVSDLRADEMSVAIRQAADAVRDTVKGGELQRGLARIDSVTAELERVGKRANEVLANPGLDQGIADLAAAAKSLRETADRLAKSLPETMARVDGAMDAARTAITDAKIPETTASLRDGVTEIGGAARNVAAAREDLAAALRQVADAGRSISRLADYLERHPEAVLNGRSGSAGGK